MNFTKNVMSPAKGSHLTKNEILLLAVAAIYNLCAVMASVFMNVYLYIYTGSLVIMAVYTAIRIAMFPPFFTLAGKMARRYNFSLTLCIGLILLAVQLAMVLFLNEQFAIYSWLVYLVALVYGIGESFLWCSINSLMQIVTTPETRSTFVTWQGICNNIASIAAPVLSGLIIMISPNDTEGYIHIFQLVLVVYVVLVVLGFQIKAKAKDKPFSTMRCLRLSKVEKREERWKINSVGTYLYGINNSLALMLSGLLVYNATGSSGGLYSNLLAVFAVMAIIAYFLCSKTMSRPKILKYYIRGSIFLASATIVLALVPNIWGALYYGIVNALSTPFYSNAYTLLGLSAIGAYEGEENVTGRVIARETYLSFGRVSGMALIVLASFVLPEQLFLPVSVVVVSLFSVAAAVFTKIEFKRHDLRP